MRLVHHSVLLTVISLVAVTAFTPDYPVEFSVETYWKPPYCKDQILHGERGLFNYKIFFLNGTLFDSSGFFGFVHVGAPNVSKGYSQGVVGMCVGEKRIITVPPDLAFGDNGAYPLIPPGTPLQFETQLVRIVPDDEEF